MPAFPGTVRVAGTLSATDGAVIVTEDRLSLQAGEDNLGNWSLDTLDVAHKGRAITISIDGEIVVFMTDNADQLVEAVEEGARRAAETAAVRNNRIKTLKRPRIGRKATAKRKIELYEEHHQSAPPPPPPPGAAAEPGADPWLRQITMNAPLLTPVEEPSDDEQGQPADMSHVLTEELSALTQPLRPAAAAATLGREDAPTEPALPEETPVRESPAVPADRTEHEEAAPRPVRRRFPKPQVRPSLLVAIAAVAGIVALGVFFTEAVTIVTLGVAATAVMVAIAGLMDEAIELRLPTQLSVTRLFGLGLALLAASMALTSLT